jgi:dihydrofolate reductase
LIKAIFACDDHWGIGKNNTLPWPHNSSDLVWFKSSTANSLVVMGRNTWESLPVKPLPNRVNCVISSNNNITAGYHARYSGKDVSLIIKDVIEKRHTGIANVWIIGGAQLFESCIDVVEELWLSRINGIYDCDTFLPKDLILEKFELYERCVDILLTTEKYRKKNNGRISSST